MPWYAVSPRDPADPRWPLPGKTEITLKADDPRDARRRFVTAYPSAPFGSPAVPDAGPAGLQGDADALLVTETGEPPAAKN